MIEAAHGDRRHAGFNTLRPLRVPWGGVDDGTARASRVPTRARRPARARGGGRDRLPPRLPVGPRRLPRRRHVLRPLRLPDHHPAPRGVTRVRAASTSRAFWIRRARRLLPALLLVLAAIAVYAAWCDADRRASRAPRRRPVRALLLGQLALHRRQQLVLRPLRRAVARSSTRGRSRSRSSSTWCGRSSSRRASALGRGPAKRCSSSFATVRRARVGSADGARSRTTRHGRTSAPTRGCTHCSIGALLAVLLGRDDTSVPRSSAVARRRRRCALAVIVLAYATIGDEQSLMYRGGFLLFALAVAAVIAAAVHPTGPVRRASLARGPRLDRTHLLRPVPVALAGPARRSTPNAPASPECRSTSCASPSPSRSPPCRTTSSSSRSDPERRCGDAWPCPRPSWAWPQSRLPSSSRLRAPRRLRLRSPRPHPAPRSPSSRRHLVPPSTTTTTAQPPRRASADARRTGRDEPTEAPRVIGIVGDSVAASLVPGLEREAAARGIGRRQRRDRRMWRGGRRPARRPGPAVLVVGRLRAGGPDRPERDHHEVPPRGRAVAQHVGDAGSDGRRDPHALRHARGRPRSAS